MAQIRKGKWFITKKGNRCRYLYLNNIKVGANVRGKPRKDQNKYKRYSSTIYFHNKKGNLLTQIYEKEKLRDWQRARREYQSKKRKKLFWKGFGEGKSDWNYGREGMLDDVEGNYSLSGDNYGINYFKRY